MLILPLLKIVLTSVVFGVGTVLVVRRLFNSNEQEPFHVINRVENEDRVHSWDNMCVVCDTNINSNEARTLPCNHTFHRDCLESYVIVRSLDNRSPYVCPIINCQVEFQM